MADPVGKGGRLPSAQVMTERPTFPPRCDQNTGYLIFISSSRIVSKSVGDDALLMHKRVSDPVSASCRVLPLAGCHFLALSQ